MDIPLDVDPESSGQVLAVSDEKTREAAVTRALVESPAGPRQKHLLELIGPLDGDTSFDCKADRSRRLSSWRMTSSGRVKKFC